MERPGRLLIVSGPPGAGKTTTARRLVATFALAVHLHTDDFFDAIRSGFVLPWLAESQRQNVVVTEAIAAAAAAYARGGYDVVVDGVIGPWLLDPYLAAAAGDRIDVHYLVLRPSHEATLARVRGREDHPLTDSGPVSLMHQAFADLGVHERHVIDTTDQTVEQTLAVVGRAYRRGNAPTVRGVKQPGRLVG